MKFLGRSALIWMVSIILIALLPRTNAASFDCARANAQVEIVICGDAILSGLDSTLAAEMKAAIARQHDQRRNLLAKQHEWLHLRDKTCTTAVSATPEARERASDCLRVIYAERIAELRSNGPVLIDAPEINDRDVASRWNGRWSVTFPCLLSKAECDGRSDVFDVDFWSRGSRLCGSHFVTAHLGNRVDGNDGDRPSIVGTIDGPTATVAFKSSWGGSGHAKVIKIDDHLFWRIIDHDDVDSWFPDEAVLTQQPKSVNEKTAPKSCDAVQPEATGGG